MQYNEPKSKEQLIKILKKERNVTVTRLAVVVDFFDGTIFRDVSDKELKRAKLRFDVFSSYLKILSKEIMKLENPANKNGLDEVELSDLGKRAHELLESMAKDNE